MANRNAPLSFGPDPVTAPNAHTAYNAESTFGVTNVPLPVLYVIDEYIFRNQSWAGLEQGYNLRGGKASSARPDAAMTSMLRRHSPAWFMHFRVVFPWKLLTLAQRRQFRNQGLGEGNFPCVPPLVFTPAPGVIPPLVQNAAPVPPTVPVVQQGPLVAHSAQAPVIGLRVPRKAIAAPSSPQDRSGKEAADDATDDRPNYEGAPTPLVSLGDYDGNKDAFKPNDGDAKASIFNAKPNAVGLPVEEYIRQGLRHQFTVFPLRISALDQTGHRVIALARFAPAEHRVGSTDLETLTIFEHTMCPRPQGQLPGSIYVYNPTATNGSPVTVTPILWTANRLWEQLLHAAALRSTDSHDLVLDSLNQFVDQLIKDGGSFIHLMPRSRLLRLFIQLDQAEDRGTIFWLLDIITLSTAKFLNEPEPPYEDGLNQFSHYLVIKYRYSYVGACLGYRGHWAFCARYHAHGSELCYTRLQEMVSPELQARQLYTAAIQKIIRDGMATPGGIQALGNEKEVILNELVRARGDEAHEARLVYFPTALTHALR
ncbi:hypothetical protein CC80DRAFT_550021 [Byssothecium circinans]|uniref:Uncharacterized protein n=1 Tax=Byssothecium circinans TaxID=147558 RepID=A0A6A5TRD8_9PLEO|nr:hypothetical protein CC80DRAFT_550021 [Byssothecium circinans]